MASNYFKAIHNHHHDHLRRRHSIDCPVSSSSSSASPHFLSPIKTTHTQSSSSATSSLKSLFGSIFSTFAVSSTTTTVPSTSSNNKNTISFDALEEYLAAKNYREADEETRRLLIVLAGESAENRGYVFFSEVQFISESDLKTIDELWRKYSDEKFGYSVQKKIWKKMNRDFTKFFLKVGWMKKLDTEIEQYNYRSFPNEFIWHMSSKDDDVDVDKEKEKEKEIPPDGHLPLTNALRGTQLLNSILNHPAFKGEEEEEEIDEKNGSEKNGGLQSVNEDDDDDKGLKKKKKKKSRVFKRNYSF